MENDFKKTLGFLLMAGGIIVVAVGFATLINRVFNPATIISVSDLFVVEIVAGLILLILGFLIFRS